MGVRYKQKCARCKKNYVTASFHQRYVLCYDCQKDALQGEIADPAMKQMFDLPEEFYRQNAFLRNIKASYLRYHKLTEKQVSAFKKAVDAMKHPKEGSLPGHAVV